MSNPSRDTIVSVILLMFCGFLIWAGFLIRDPQFGELSPAAWPKGVTYVLTAFCFIFFVQSVLADRAGRTDETAPINPVRDPGLIGWVRYFFNPIVCFALYFGFLYTLPYFGTLIWNTDRRNAVGLFAPQFSWRHRAEANRESCADCRHLRRVDVGAFHLRSAGAVAARRDCSGHLRRASDDHR